MLGSVYVESVIRIESEQNVGRESVDLILQIATTQVVKECRLVEVHESAFNEMKTDRYKQLSSTGLESSSSAG